MPRKETIPAYAFLLIQINEGTYRNAKIRIAFGYENPLAEPISNASCLSPYRMISFDTVATLPAFETTVTVR
jgi:hypothetical protein